MTETRNCPVDGCTRQHPRSFLMCRQHWYAVPKELRDAVWRTYDHGRGLMAEEYAEARDAAIAAAELAEV